MPLRVAREHSRAPLPGHPTLDSRPSRFTEGSAAGGVGQVERVAFVTRL